MMGMRVVLSVLSLLCLDLAAGTPTVSPTPCSEPEVFCFADPCTVTTCIAHLDATCRSNYCGGCNAEFFDTDGTEVTASCNPITTATPTTAATPLSCPPPSDGFGICPEQCGSDRPCADGQLCCSTGCGHACMEGIPTQTTTTSASPRTTAPPCTLPCPLPLCIEGYYLVTLQGDCCPTCQRDCRAVRCAYPTCPDGPDDDTDADTPITPPDQCCPVCPPVVCFSDIYPDEPRTCLVVVPRWTFTRESGCSQINFSPCGQQEEGYNVFADQQNCNSTCGHLTISSCTLIQCDWPICPGDATPVFLPSDCCPSCPSTPTPPDCSTVLCALPRCAGGVEPTTPPGECCPQCPETGGCVTIDGRVIASGDTFPAPDGCNTCFCGDDGSIGCTEIACITSPTPAVIRPDPLHALICPYVDPSMAGICALVCSSDGDCEEDQMCCSNGCGRVCMNPDRVPYYTIPLECPSNTLLDLRVMCDTSQRQCRENSDCTDQLCCQRGSCGQYCTAGVASSQPCLAVRELFSSSLGGIPGAFIPACQDDGRFSPSQFHGSTGLSWCVDVGTGYPLSPYYPRGSPPECASCMDGAGNSYQVGQSFPSLDCNSCFCVSGGRVVCTLIACPATCSLSPETGPCRAAIPAFYYDSTSESCRQFTYGGCGGNANKFRSQQDCLTMCDPTSRCLQEKAVGDCDAIIPSFFFNITSGACERFNYGGCGGNRNRFSTGAECMEACLPDTPPDRCSLVRCAEPDCPPGSELTRDDIRCCPYCVTQTVECRRDEMQCFTGECISQSLTCDSLRDCPNREDEDNCDDCDFRCGDGSCIESSRVCDSVLDCTDHSDAENCSRGLTGGVVYLQPSDIPQQCPDANDVPAECRDTCTRDDAQCQDGQACCETGCSVSSCTATIPVKPACHMIARQVQQAGLLGAFTPSCEEDGTFSEQQCRERFCWCVDVLTGQPVTDATEAASLSPCTRCRRENGDSLPVGASFSSDDGCNTGKCTKEYGIIRTNQHCVTKSCRLGDATIAHEQSYRDACTTCMCISGRLRCDRMSCPVVEEPVTVTMTFKGNYDMLIIARDQLIREVKRTLLILYNELNLLEEQLQAIKLFKGSIVVSITLEPMNNTGANVTIVLSQLEQDYTSGILVIRYDGMVLQPTGEFQTGEFVTGSPSASAGLLWWHYLLIAVGAVLLLLTCITVVAVVVFLSKRSKKTNPYQEALTDNEYDVSFKKDQGEIAFQ